MSTEPVNEAAFFSTIRSWRLVRSESRVFGGVLGGVGARIGMAPAPTRILFVLAALLTGGFAVLLYAASWALLPDHEGHIIAQDFGRGRPNVGALVAIGILTLFGFLGLGHVGFNPGWIANVARPAIDAGMFNGGMFGGGLARLFILFFAIAVPLLIVGGIVFAIVWAVRSSNGTRNDATGYARLPDGSLPTGSMPPDAGATHAGDLASVTVAAANAGDATMVNAAVEPPQPTPSIQPSPPATPQQYATPQYSPPLYTAPPPPPPAPRKPRVPGPGKVGYLLALALIPISAAITLYLSSTDQLAVYPAIAGGVIYTAGLGLVLAINAVRGRKAGFLGFVSVVALIPTVLVIAAAPQIRDHYATGDWPSGWHLNVGNQDEPSAVAEPSYGGDPVPEAFDPSVAFSDYSFVAISGSCFTDQGVTAPEGAGIVSLSSVTADQSVTVSGSQTHIIIPRGTSLMILNDSSSVENGVDVSWVDRDVTCSSDGGTASPAQLTNADEPVLTIRVNGTQGMGNLSLWIEEN